MWPEADFWECDFIDVLNYSKQKYFRKTKEDHSQKSASGHNWWSLFSLAVETLGLLGKYVFLPFFTFLCLMQFKYVVYLSIDNAWSLI